MSDWNETTAECELSSEDEVPESTLGGLSGMLGSLLGKHEELYSNPPLARATRGSAGYDLCALTNCVISPGETVLVDTGVRIDIPEGYYCQVLDRSSMVLKDKKTSPNGILYTNRSMVTLAGVIDSDYTGTIGVLLHNLGMEKYTVVQGERIAQLVIHKIYTFTNELPTLKNETFAHDGFGSTN